MCDTGYQNNERFILIQCFNDVTAINYIAENHIVKKNTGSIYAAHYVGLTYQTYGILLCPHGTWSKKYQRYSYNYTRRPDGKT